LQYDEIVKSRQTQSYQLRQLSNFIRFLFTIRK